MRSTPRMMIRGLLKLVAVVVAAGVVGAGVGIVLAELGGSEDSASLAPQSTSTTTSSTTSSTPAQTPTQTTTQPTTKTQTQATPATRAPTARIELLSAVLYPASTASGRSRRRARVVVRARVTNRGDVALAPSDLLLLVGTERIGIDLRKTDIAGALLDPVAPGGSATGELRFETAGAVTQRLTSEPRANLRIADRTVAVSIRISDTPAPRG